jgi:hypothetical protein
MPKTTLIFGTILLTLFAGASLLFSQTGITVDMLRFVGPGDIIMRVGQVLQPVLLDVDSSFVLDTSTTPPTLRTQPNTVEFPFEPVRIIATVATEETTMVLPSLPVDGTLTVSRNGVTLSHGVDFNWSQTQQSIVFLATDEPNNVPKVGNVVRITYWTARQ